MKLRKNHRPIALLAAALAVGTGIVGVRTFDPAPAQAIDLVSERQELEAGHQAARQVESKYRVVTGTHEARMVEDIGRDMASVSGRPRIPWRFRVIEEPSVNAFSVPGYVYIHTGLIRATGGDVDELAGVIAHEVAHTDARHSKEQMEKGAVAGILGSLISRGNNRKGGWFNLGAGLVMLNYSRNDEYEADRLAVRYMKRTGFNPNGMIEFFQKLQQKEGRGNKVGSFFRTHPYSSDRISRIRSEIRR